MRPICKNCQYQREQGAGDEVIPGEGMWCSNSQSPRFFTRVLSTDSCDGFQARGKKAGLGLQLKVKGMGFVNKMLRRKK